MADSIWASIDAQLDAVVEDVPQQKTRPHFKGKAWIGFAGLMVAASLLWWHLSHQAPAPPATPAVPPVAPVIKTPPATTAPQKDTVMLLPQRPAPVPPLIIPKDTLEANDSIAADSVVERVLPIMKMEPPLRRHAPDSATVTPVPKVKKPKGVGGITNDDYRIGVEKDSTKKKTN